MFVVEGMKLKGNSFKWKYENNEFNVAKFEFEASIPVSSYVVLAEDNNGLYKQIDLYYRG